MSDIVKDFDKAMSVAKYDLSSHGSLAKIRKDKGEGKVLVMLTTLLQHAQDMLNVPTESGRHIKQVNFLRKWILKEYFFYKLDDVRTIIERGITGKYGKTYNRLDVEIISTWFNCYESERIEKIEQSKKNIGSVEFHPEVANKWREIRQKLDAKLKLQAEQDKKRFNSLEGWCDEYAIQRSEAVDIISKAIHDRYDVYKIKASDVSFNHWHDHCYLKLHKNIHQVNTLDGLAQLMDSLTSNY